MYETTTSTLFADHSAGRLSGVVASVAALHEVDNGHGLEAAGAVPTGAHATGEAVARLASLGSQEALAAAVALIDGAPLGRAVGSATISATGW